MPRQTESEESSIVGQREFGKRGDFKCHQTRFQTTVINAATNSEDSPVKQDQSIGKHARSGHPELYADKFAIRIA